MLDERTVSESSFTTQLAGATAQPQAAGDGIRSFGLPLRLFYSILQMQDYALLMGSLGLLLILAVIMYLTRNVDWFGLKREE